LSKETVKVIKEELIVRYILPLRQAQGQDFGRKLPLVVGLAASLMPIKQILRLSACGASAQDFACGLRRPHNGST
jgi:hypothetical protein